MTNKTYKELLNSMDKKERNEGKGDYYTFISLNTNDTLKDYLINLVYSDGGIASGDNSLNYDILYQAIAYLADNNITLTQFKKLDINEDIAERSEEFACIYTMEQLAYLNIWNQTEITDMVKEMSLNINEACAYWYDMQVIDTLYKLQDYINNN